jgi:hypothetical protein
MNRKQNFARSVAATALLCSTIVPGRVAVPVGAVEEFKGFCVLGYPQYYNDAGFVVA